MEYGGNRKKPVDVAGMMTGKHAWRSWYGSHCYFYVLLLQSPVSWSGNICSYRRYL